ncbi:MAG TPA: 4-aminobutyrate--2-oxoglutarate transaminase [Candidatus Binataceae bacterium]|nr:4-aminobutyrate--2-oxoglutarate transaminase [Candidatus Binataceae bacterium]
MATNESLMARRDAAVARGVSRSHSIFVERGQNAELWDVEGRRYVDFAGGISVLNVGQRHPRVISAVTAQLERYIHTCFQVLSNEPYVALAERLNRLAPGPGKKKTLIMNSGAEAVENAIKIARRFTRRSAIIAFGGGFHGRTLLTLGLTGKVNPYKAGFGPFPAEVYHAIFPDPLRGVSVGHAIESIDALMHNDVEPSRVAAMIVEPVQGEGGFNIAPTEFLVRLRELCDQHGILLIVDEVQSGVGRTGKMFAIEHSGVIPDLLTVAKSLGAGFPISAVVGRAEVMDSVDPGGLGGTYAGNPIACAAALEVLDIMENERLLERSVAIGKQLVEGLTRLAKRYKAIGDVRGLGAMVAIELFRDGKIEQPDAELAKNLVRVAANKGLIILSCGNNGNVIRIMVPLTASDKIIEEGLRIIGESFAELFPNQ